MFADRRDAGRRLAARLAPLAAEQPIVIALPRGGVPVAVEVARALGAPLDILTVRKLGAPQNPELGVGAVTEGGTAVLNQAIAQAVGMTQAQFDRTRAREEQEVLRRVERFRDGRAPLDVRDRTVIVVDDGLATGLTDLAAVRALRRRGAARIVVAVPVGSTDAVALLAEEADQVDCLMVSDTLLSIGGWYDDFSQLSDEEVLDLLSEAGVPVPEQAAGEPVREVEFDLEGAKLKGDLTVPPEPRGLVVFAHGSGSSRRSARNRGVARTLNGAGFATLLFDLLSEQESERRELVFDVGLLASRLGAVTRWAQEDTATRELPIGYFGASTGAAAALLAAAELGDAVRAVVSRGGRPDLAAERLAEVRAPTLLIVGSFDDEVLELNRRAAQLLRCEHRIMLVERATHLFEEPGALEIVASLATEWFTSHLAGSGTHEEVEHGHPAGAAGR